MNGRWAVAKLAVVLAFTFNAPAGAADLRSHPPIFPPPLSNWSGFYGGANFGAAFSSEDITVGNGASFSTDPSGVLGGIQFGYNYLFSPNWLIGLEVEFDWTSANGRGSFANATTVGNFTSNHNWYDIVAGRLGYTMGRWFYYVKGGGAWMNADYQMMTAGAIPGGVTINNTRGGMMIGFGAEYMLTPQWSAKGEYAFLDFANQSYGFGIPVFGGTTANTQVHEIKVGVNYHVAPGTLIGGF
jgi:outer membrane immunogenic protein